MEQLARGVEDLAYWADEYAETLPDDDRIKLAEVACYLHALKRLMRVRPDDVLEVIKKS